MREQGARKAHHRLHEFKKAMETAFRHVMLNAENSWGLV